MKAIPAGDLLPMVGQYLTEKTGIVLVPGMYQGFAIVNDSNDFCGGVVLTNYRSWDIDMSCAAETPMAWRPHVLRAIFTYAFEQLGCVRVTAITTKKNTRTRSFLKHLGFELEGKVRRGYDGKLDALVYGLLAEKCQFLAVDSRGNNDEVSTAGPSAARSGSNGSGADANEQRYGGSAG